MATLQAKLRQGPQDPGPGPLDPGMLAKQRQRQARKARKQHPNRKRGGASTVRPPKTIKANPTHKVAKGDGRRDQKLVKKEG